MPRQGIISAGTVQESSFPLSAGTGHRSAKIAGRIKDQTAGPSECVGTDPLKAQWKVDYQIASDRMDVGLDSGVSAAKNIFLSISVETIIALRGEPTVDVITVTDLKTACVSGRPRGSSAATVVRESAGALQTDL
jgi:hypothetical protein